MVTKPSTDTDKVELFADRDTIVMVYPADYDVFIMSQREAVEALRDKHRAITQAEEIRKSIDELFVDIAGWCAERPDVVQALWTPRTDDVLIAILASGEDEGGELSEAVSALDLQLFDKYFFRLNLMLFRDSEADGLDRFVKPDEARQIYLASRDEESGERTPSARRASGKQSRIGPEAKTSRG